MSEYKSHGSYKDCPVCGKHFYVMYPEKWTYKHEGHLRGEDKRTYLCSWHCLREHEALYIKRREQAQKESRERARDKRKATLKSVKIECADRHCDECRYFEKDKYGFSICHISTAPVTSIKMACRRFKTVDEPDKRKDNAKNWRRAK